MTNQNKTRRLNLLINCRAYYNSHIDVPADLTFDEAIKYAKRHINEVPIEGYLEYTEGYDELDTNNCYFDDEIT